MIQDTLDRNEVGVAELACEWKLRRDQRSVQPEELWGTCPKRGRVTA